MDGMGDGHLIRDEAALEALYGEPSAGAVMKEVDHVHPHYRAFIEAAPFLAMATSGPGGLDVTPRGDPAGFVEVADDKTLLIPDRRGNNRADSLRNLIHDPRIALLFLIPGVGETLRVNGTAVDLRGAGPAGAVSGAGETAALGDRGAGGERVFPVPEGAGAVRSVEPGEADSALGAAERGDDPGGYQPGAGGRGGV